jgi:hypothetical protein
MSPSAPRIGDARAVADTLSLGQIPFLTGFDAPAHGGAQRNDYAIQVSAVRSI